MTTRENGPTVPPSAQSDLAADLERERELSRQRGAWLTDAREQIERLRAERDRAIEVRENANAVSMRLEAENRRLRLIIADLIEDEAAEECTLQWYALRNARAALDQKQAESEEA